MRLGRSEAYTKIVEELPEMCREMVHMPAWFWLPFEWNWGGS
jgi:hypothetical protein